MIELIMENMPWFWFFAAIAFAIIEGTTMSLTTIWFAIGAVLLAFVSQTGIPPTFQVLLFLVVSGALLLFCRKAAKDWFATKRENTNVDALAGKTALVVKNIEKFEKGEIKVDGTVWTARTEDGSSLAENSECVIKKIEGVTAVVVPKKTNIQEKK